MDWSTLIMLVGSLGGLELLKWGWNVVANRRTDARKADSEADASEFRVLQEAMLFLQTQLSDKEKRFAEQTALVRQLNREVIGLEQQKAVLEVELVRVRCDDERCPFRMPPNALTPATPGLTREEYFRLRLNSSRTEQGEVIQPPAQQPMTPNL